MTAAGPEVLVLGGGPAGCAAAQLLARWGHRVQLVTRPGHGPRLGESIPPSTARLFDLLDLRTAVDAAGFVRTTGNTVWWGESAPRIERFPATTAGWQVTTDALAAIMNQAAAAAGVSIVHDRMSPAAAAGVGARFTLDCTGRAGVLARSRRLRQYESRLRTVALAGLWQMATGFEHADPTHTWIESYDGGWAWSVPHATRERFVAVMVDPRTSNLARQADAREVYERELRKTTQMAAFVRHAALVEGPAGWDASMYSATRYVDGDVLLVGDAGSFIDPLSSAGVKKALASGWLAAVAVHTSLIRPGMRQVALDYFAAREAEVYAAFRAMTERYLAHAAAGHQHPFWSDRTEVEAAAPQHAPIVEAFARLRAAPALRVRRAADLRIEPQPTVTGAEIVLEPHLVTGTRPGGVRFVFGVDVLTLLELAPEVTSVPDLFDVYNRRRPPVALPDLLGALATAIGEGWLRWV